MNATASNRLVPSDRRADETLSRATTAHCVAAARGMGARPEQIAPEQIARQFWPRDAATLALIGRSAIGGATTTTSGWAAELVAARAVAGFLGTLQASTAARRIAAAMQISLPGYAQIVLPRASSTGTPKWTAEGQPIVVASPPPTSLGVCGLVIARFSRSPSRRSSSRSRSTVAASDFDLDQRQFVRRAEYRAGNNTLGDAA
jgi:hypothetical protein